MTADIHMPFFSNINLDLVKTQAWVPQQIFATEGDNGYGQIFSLYENGNPYTSATVNNLNFRAIKPDNNVVDIKGPTGFKAIDGQSNQFAFQVPAQTFHATGRVECYFYVTNSENTIVASTTHFFYEVQRSVPSGDASVSYIASLEDVVKHAKELEGQALTAITAINQNKFDTDKQKGDFGVDLMEKQKEIEKQADQMLADTKAALDKTTGATTDYQQKLDDLNKQYISKYNELLAQLPSASDAVKKQISDALAQIKDDEQDAFQKISMDWVNKKQDLDKSIQAYQDTVSKQLDSLKAQISTLSGDNVTQLSKQIDDLQTKLNNMHLADYYTKKEIDDKLDNYQHSIDLSGYETSSHAEQTYAKKSDIVAPDLSVYETKTDAEQTYAKKTDIPAQQDLTDYAKTADVAKTYETKADAYETYAKKTDIVAPDLSSYETSKHASDTYETKADAATHITKETADAAYANKADLPDLTDYAKKSDIPAAPDLSSYAKSADIAKTYETKEDASTHLTKEDAQSTYATKDDLANAKPDLTGYAKTSDIPNVSGFETSSHAEQTYETKVDAEQTYAKKTDIPSAPNMAGYVKNSDLASYAKTTDLVSYETKTDADSTYAKKSDIPTAPDLSSYLTKADANNTFVTNVTAASYIAGSTSIGGSMTDVSIISTNIKANNGQLYLLDPGLAFPNLINVHTEPEHDDNNKAVIAASSSFEGSGFIFKEDDKFFLSGHRLLTDTDASQYLTTATADSTYAKKSDIPNLSTYLTKADADADYVSNTDLSNKKYMQMISFAVDNLDYSAGKVEKVNYTNGETSNVMRIDLAKLSDLIKPYIAANAYNKSQSYDDSKSLSSTYAGGQDLSNIAYPCVVDIKFVPYHFDETNDPKELSKNVNVIVRRRDNYYLGGHKLAFAD